MALRRTAVLGARHLLTQSARLAEEGFGILQAEVLLVSPQLPFALRAFKGSNRQRHHLDEGFWRALHSAAAPASQPIAKETDEQDFDGAANTPSSSGRQMQQTQEASTFAEAARSTAEACDQMLGSLQAAKSKAALSQSNYNPYPTSLAVRIRQAGKTVYVGVLTVVKFVFSIPKRLSNFVALSGAERREIYHGWWVTIKKEAHHYWMGTKLLGADIKIASRLVYKTLRGKTLSRRERRQLTRTSADVFRLVPFAVFVLVPFMEVLLPVALKLFPNMLPSTFEDKLKKEEDLKRRLTAKLEVARFLQDTVQEMAKDMKSKSTGKTQASASQLYDFMKRVRAGESISNYELMKFASLFNDELTLDNLERIHLVNLCRFVGISPFGTDSFLVSRLRHHLAEIKRDDRAIQDEGLDALTEEELRAACRARGMRAPFGEGAVRFMQRQLTEWLDLSLNRALPSSLLLLSRAFTVTQPMAKTKEGAEYEGLKDTLSTLPKEVIDEIAMASPADGTDLGQEYARKLEQLRREEDLIHEEELEAEALAESSEAVPQKDQSTERMTAAATASAIVREAAASAVVDALEGMSEEEKASKLATAKEEKMRKVLSALTVLASSSGVTTERHAFMDLVKNEIQRLNSQMSSKGSLSMVFRAGGVTIDRPEKLVEVVGQKRLADKVTTILGRIEKELDEADSNIGNAMHVLDLDNDGLVSKEELQTAMTFLRAQLGEDELRLLLERMDAFNDDTKLDVNQLMTLAEGKGPPERAQRLHDQPILGTVPTQDSSTSSQAQAQEKEARALL